MLTSLQDRETEPRFQSGGGRGGFDAGRGGRGGYGGGYGGGAMGGGASRQIYVSNVCLLFPNSLHVRVTNNEVVALPDRLARSEGSIPSSW